ncbi:uncharacterized protein LOC119111742, partial [Pollicipes pollicipes]|uniref:uncharacterized protein LOC119111742 n=1 Tax=Pollicipes pollicipes TaxID=41117 RepID=UPI001884B543
MDDQEGSVKSVTFQSMTLPPLGRGGSSGAGLRTPVRCLRLFVFAFLVPAALIAVPLYQRRVTLAPRLFTLTATDMRSVLEGISSVWCEAQELSSDTPFTTYRAAGPLPQRSRRLPVTLHHRLTLSDDIKEFWGFYLLRGSRISVSACARWPGTTLLLVQGWAALNDCIWVGQIDSLEEESSEEEDNDDLEEEEDFLDPVRKRWKEFIRQARLPAPGATVAPAPTAPDGEVKPPGYSKPDRTAVWSRTGPAKQTSSTPGATAAR